jgi:hypothetical protein
MVKNKYFIVFLLMLFHGFSGCDLKKDEITKLKMKQERNFLRDKYPKIPQEEILLQANGTGLYVELQQKYKAALAELKSDVEDNCGKLVVVVLTPQVGKASVLENQYGIPFILESCGALNIDCIDLTPSIAAKDLNELTQLPEDLHWSKSGSIYVASLFVDIIEKYRKYRSTKVFKDSSRSPTFGDLDPNMNEVVEGKNNLPFKLKTNKQGLRMDHNVTFPKKKQTILFLGNTWIYSPYLNNEFIATQLLQNIYPDKEILNAGYENYTIEDYESLYFEKARYAEPDVIILCTDGIDIVNNFFSQRNHYSRLLKPYPPSAEEKRFYNQIYNYSTPNN